MTRSKKLTKQYAPPKLKKLPLIKAKLSLQNKAAHGDMGAKNLLDLLATPPKKK